MAQRLAAYEAGEGPKYMTSGKRDLDPRAVEIGERLTLARKELDGQGMTQRELSDLLGVSERSVAAYEAGEVIPYRFIRDLEKILNRPAEWILHGKDPSADLNEVLEEVRALRREVQSALGRLP